MANMKDIQIKIMNNEHLHFDELVAVIPKHIVDAIDNCIVSSSIERLKQVHHDAAFLMDQCNVTDLEVQYIRITSGMEWQYKEYRAWEKSQG